MSLIDINQRNVFLNLKIKNQDKLIIGRDDTDIINKSFKTELKIV